MPFIIFAMICITLGAFFPSFNKFMNWFVLFPIATLAFGSIAFAAVNLITGFSLMSFKIYSGFLLIVGLPIGIFVTKESLS